MRLMAYAGNEVSHISDTHKITFLHLHNILRQPMLLQ